LVCIPRGAGPDLERLAIDRVSWEPVLVNWAVLSTHVILRTVRHIEAFLAVESGDRAIERSVGDRPGGIAVLGQARFSVRCARREGDGIPGTWGSLTCRCN
jgi:hypothetical protein